MTGTPIQLRDRGGRVVFEGTQDGGGGSQTVKCVDLGVVAFGDIAAGPVTLYTPGAGEIVTAVFATDVVLTDGPGIAVGRAVILGSSNSRFEAWPQASLDNDTYHDSYGIAGRDPGNAPNTSDPVFASGSSTVDAPPATIWEANAAHAHLDVVFANGTYWQTDDEGNSAAIEPDWASNAGSSVSDGDLTWNDSSVPPPAAGSLHAYAVVMTPAAP